MDVTVIIPARNEEQRIGTTLERYLGYFGDRLRFLVVVNGTTDRTAAIVSSITKRFPSVLTQIVIPEAIGKGGAVHEGFRQVKTELVAYLDADGATEPAEFERLLTALGDADGVIASRRLPGARADRTPLRRFTGYLFHLAVRWFIGLRFQDTQCGAKIFRTAPIQRILPKLIVRNMAFDVELLGYLIHTGSHIKEVPTVWREIPGPADGWQRHLVRTGLDMARTLLSIRRRLAAFDPQRA